MLEYFTYKKVKKVRNEKAQREHLENEARDSAATSPAPQKTPTAPVVISKPDEPYGDPLLDQDDEKWLERIVSPDAGYDDNDDVASRPPLPPRIPTPIWDTDDESATSQQAPVQGKGKGKEVDVGSEAKPGNKRLSVIANIGRTISMRRKPTEKSGLQPQLEVPAREVVREVTDINKVLDDLNLSAQNNKVFSLSAESTEMVRKFNLVLKDIVNGAPTAYQDLVNLIEDRDGILAKNYEKLPKSLQKLVTQLPTKLSSTLAPELLAVAAEAQGLNKMDASAQGGLKGAAKSFLTPKSLQDLVTKPGAVAGLLKSIVNVLKTRWPAFMGTNVLWSISLFLLLSVLWYCHKRGREVRLEKEAGEQSDPLYGVDRVEELPDDPLLEGFSRGQNSLPATQRSGKSSPVLREASKKKK